MLIDKVILVPSFGLVSFEKRRRVEEYGPQLGLQVTTPDVWARELWELWGDGRILVDQTRLSLLVHGLLTKQSECLGENVLPATSGMAKSLARFYQEVSGHPLFELAVKQVPDSLSPAEQAVLALFEPLGSLLKARGLVLDGQRLAFLSDRIPKTKVELRGNHQLSASMGWFLSQQNAACSSRTDGAIPALDESMRPLFFYAAGQSVIPRLILEGMLNAFDNACVLGADAKAPCSVGMRLAPECPPGGSLPTGAKPASVLVISKDPKHLFESFARVAPVSISLAFKGGRCVRESHIGRLVSCLDALDGGDASLQCVSSVIRSPYMGLGSAESLRVDAAFRADRSLSGNRLESFLHERLPHYLVMSELLHSSFCEDAVSEALVVLNKAFLPGTADCQFEKSCLEVLAVTLACAGDLGSSKPFALELALDSAVSVSVEAKSDGEELAKVLVLAPGDAADLTPGCFDAVVFAESDDRSYAARSTHAALDNLVRKLGIWLDVDPARDLRRLVVQASDLATKFVGFCFCPLSADGSDCYPAFFLEEFVSHYQEGDALAFGELSVGSESGAGLFVLGEEEITSNLVGQVETQEESSVVIGVHEIGPGSGSVLANTSDEGFVCSASGIETYLLCPRKWFLTRQLKADGLDEDFGSLERGSFVHAVWQEFYERFTQHCGHLDTFDDEYAPSLLDGVFDQQLLNQVSAGAGRYLPITEEERVACSKLKRELIANLTPQALLLQQYMPTHFEYRISREDGLKFAGATLQGSVDRIDIDTSNGRYAVIDYKGSVSGHAAGFDELKRDNKTLKPKYFEENGLLKLPGKVQTLIYAQALRQRFEPEGLVPSAAIYLSYRADTVKDFVSGSVSETIRQYAPETTEVKGDFCHYLDLVEEALVPVVQNMKEGHVSPNPAKGACRHCPDKECPRRLNS